MIIDVYLISDVHVAMHNYVFHDCFSVSLYSWGYSCVHNTSYDTCHLSRCRDLCQCICMCVYFFTSEWIDIRVGYKAKLTRLDTGRHSIGCMYYYSITWTVDCLVIQWQTHIAYDNNSLHFPYKITISLYH